MESIKETLEEAAENRFGTDMDSIRGSNVYDLNADLKKGFIAGAKWQQETSYSEEDMAESFMACWKANVPEGFDCKLAFNEWFEQFKKK